MQLRAADRVNCWVPGYAQILIAQRRASAGLAYDADPPADKLTLADLTAQIVAKQPGINPPVSGVGLVGGEKDVVKESPLGTETVPYRFVEAKGLAGIDFATLRFDPKLQKEVADFEQPQMGIYRLQGDDLTVCLNEYLAKRPTAVAAKGEADHVYLVFRLRRLPPPDKAARRPQTPPEGDAVLIAKNPKLLALAKQKYEAALQEFDGRLKNIAIGKGSPDQFYIEASERILRSKLDLAPSREAQADAMEEHWVRIRTAEDIAQTKFDVRKEDITELARFRRARLDLELRIEWLRKHAPRK
jgi:hypothetical protein